jgi:hypothetical protein
MWMCLSRWRNSSFAGRNTDLPHFAQIVELLPPSLFKMGKLTSVTAAMSIVDPKRPTIGKNLKSMLSQINNGIMQLRCLQ